MPAGFLDRRRVFRVEKCSGTLDVDLLSADTRWKSACMTSACTGGSGSRAAGPAAPCRRVPCRGSRRGTFPSQRVEQRVVVDAMVDRLGLAAVDDAGHLAGVAQAAARTVPCALRVECDDFHLNSPCSGSVRTRDQSATDAASTRRASVDEQRHHRVALANALKCFGRAVRRRSAGGSCCSRGVCRTAVSCRHHQFVERRCLDALDRRARQHRVRAIGHDLLGAALLQHRGRLGTACRRCRPCRP